MVATSLSVAVAVGDVIVVAVADPDHVYVNDLGR